MNHTATSSYDALNRLVQLTDPNHGNTRYAYNGRDQLVSVTDPRNLTTQYSYTGLNDLTNTVSPDTGTTQKTYDEAGNLLTSTDAKGQTTLYTYDALNRVTQIAFAGGAAHTYQYDQGDNGLGRLTRIIDNSSITGYVYDQHGRVLTEKRKIGETTFVTHYRYNAAGQLIAMMYPSGRVLGFAYDQANRAVRLTLDGKPLLAAIVYQPFGKAVGWTFGNGAPYERTVDLDGRIDTYTLGTDTRTLIYDPASRIVGFSSSNVTHDQTFDYDALDRLTQFIATSTTQGYAYDATGNRISQTIGAQNISYQVSSSSNQLQAVNGIRLKTYTYDANGSVIGDGTNQFTYDGRGRLVQVTNSHNRVKYQINGLGQRIAKLKNEPSHPDHDDDCADEFHVKGVTDFVYDKNGYLIGEYARNGKPIRETVYLGDTPVAVLVGEAQYFIYADHLNTPRVITDTRNRVVWRWDASDPFGATPPNENPSGRGHLPLTCASLGNILIRRPGCITMASGTMIPARGGILRVIRLGCKVGSIRMPTSMGIRLPKATL